MSMTTNRIVSGLLYYCCITTSIQAGVELDRIVAVVNDDVIMMSALEAKVLSIKNQLREQGSPLRPSSILEKQVLDRLILTKLQIQMAEF